MGLIELFWWINAGRGAAAALKWIGVGRLLGWLLGARTGVVRASGFVFFPDRNAMNALRNLSEAIQGAKTVKMILVGGSKLIEEPTNVGNVTKVILPHPESLSISTYAVSVKDHGGLQEKIRTTTRLLQKKGIKVGWYKDMINHAIVIADPDRDSGWIQWESVLPYVYVPERPCVVVYKPRFEGLIASINASFDQMFDASELPPHKNDG